MPSSRRAFLQTSAAFAAAFGGLRNLLAAPSIGHAMPVSGYGPLVADPRGVLDLPKGFSYQVVSRTDDEMADGLLVPDCPDGMATFAGPYGLTILLRNHELSPEQPGAFGAELDRFNKVDPAKLYDLGEMKTPATGGVTTVVYDTRLRQVVRQFMSLAGTIRNCAGGPTPWGSWITCEEACDLPGFNSEQQFWAERDHGYAFEVPATAIPRLHKAEPLRAMGRFRREAVAVDPDTGIVYQTEDVDNGLIYRFVPNVPGKLHLGGHTQALAVLGRDSLDTRNWAEQTVGVGDSFGVEWIDLSEIDSPLDDLRLRGFESGAACFARGEGMWFAGGAIYFACTSGGKAQLGQLWRLTPGAQGDRLELFAEPNDERLVVNADNLTAAPWGDLIVCEDRDTDVVRLVGVTPEGGFYTLGHNHQKTEFSGAVFSPDGTTLFVNLQHAGMTLAITGPWRSVA
jgi:secreted PhoX family phosphatase